MKGMIGVILVCSIVSTAILLKIAQVGLEVQGVAEEAKANPIKTLFSFLKSKPAA